MLAVSPLWATVALGAPATTRPCPGAVILVDESLSSAWVEAVGQLRSELTQRNDVDACAEVRIVREGDHARVRVLVADGRSAERTAADPASLRATTEALLVLPAPSATAVHEHEAQADVPAPLLAPPAALRAPAEPVRAPRLEVGAGAGGRVAASPLYIAPSAFGFASFGTPRWSIDVRARLDFDERTRASTLGRDLSMQTSAIGITVTRRVEADAWRLGVAAGPAIVIDIQDYDPHGHEGRFATATDMRLALATLASNSDVAGGHVFTALDFDVSPHRLFAGPTHLASNLPALPTWSAGLGIGYRGEVF